MNAELKNRLITLKIEKAEHQGEIDFNEEMMKELRTDRETGEERAIGELTQKQQNFYLSLKYGQNDIRNKIKRIDCKLKALSTIE